VDVLAALSAAQLTPDPSMFSALAQLSSLSNNMSSNVDSGDHHHEAASSGSRFKSSSNTPKLGKPSQSNKSATPSTSNQSHKNNPSSGSKKSRLDDAGFYQGLDLSLKQRSAHKKSETRSKSPLSDD